MKTTTLQLWVENQPCDHDCTCAYISAACVRLPSDVVYDEKETTLTGPTESVWSAFKLLQKELAEIGHGEDMDEEDLAPPKLTACPVDWITPGYTSATESLARIGSVEKDTWEEFVSGY